MFAEKGDPWVVLTYAMILFFVVCFSYYRIKVTKAKVWRVVLEAVGLLMVEYLFMVLAGLALVYIQLSKNLSSAFYTFSSTGIKLFSL